LGKGGNARTIPQEKREQKCVLFNVTKKAKVVVGEFGRRKPWEKKKKMSTSYG